MLRKGKLNMRTSIRVLNMMMGFYAFFFFFLNGRWVFKLSRWVNFNHSLPKYILAREVGINLNLFILYSIGSVNVNMLMKNT